MPACRTGSTVASVTEGMIVPIVAMRHIALGNTDTNITVVTIPVKITGHGGEDTAPTITP